MPELQQQKEQQRRQPVEKTSDWYDATLVDEKPSRLSAIIFFALCAIMIFAVVTFGAVDAWALGLLALFIGVVALLWLTDSWLKREFWFNTNLLQIPLLGLIAIGLIQLLPLGGSDISGDLLSVPAADALSLAPNLTRFAVIQLLLYFVFFAAALTFINNPKRLRITVLTVIIFGSLMAFYGILQRLADLDGIYGMRETPNAITFASYVNQHHFAALMEMTLGLTLALFFGKATTKDWRIFLIIAAVVMGIALLLTGSRGGLISLLAVLGFIVAANVLKKNRGEKDSDDGEKPSNFRRNLALVGGGFALILGLFGAVIMLGGDESLLRVVGLSFGKQQDLSTGRSHFWQTALKIIFDFPILGAGLDAFGIVFPRYDTWNGTMRVEQAHNDYLQILADAGILGFVCVVSFIVLLFKQSLQIIAKASDNFRRNVAVGALAGCFGILIHSFFDFPLRTPGNSYVFLIFVVLATATINYPKLYRRKKEAVGESS